MSALRDVRPFRTDLSGVWAGLGRLIRANARYARLALVPALVLALPLILLFNQLDSRYGIPEIKAGQPVVVAIRTSNADPGHLEPRLAVPEGIRIETPAVWIPSLNEANWRVVAERPGEFDLVATIGGETVAKHLIVADPARPTSPMRSWPVPFVALSMVFTLALQRPFGVRLI